MQLSRTPSGMRSHRRGAQRCMESVWQSREAHCNSDKLGRQKRQQEQKWIQKNQFQTNKVCFFIEIESVAKYVYTLSREMHSAYIRSLAMFLQVLKVRCAVCACIGDVQKCEASISGRKCGYERVRTTGSCIEATGSRGWAVNCALHGVPPHLSSRV